MKFLIKCLKVNCYIITFIYCNVEAKKSETEIKEVMDKEANNEPYKYAIVNG